MIESEDVNMHHEANKLKEELQGIFGSIPGIEPWNVIGNFTQYLENNNIKIDNTTVYKYINETVFPAWLIPYLFEFLSQKPYALSPYVWTFIQKNSRPITKALGIVKDQEEKRKQSLLDEAKRMDTYL
jgi:hypothetical protein